MSGRRYEQKKLNSFSINVTSHFDEKRHHKPCLSNTRLIMPSSFSRRPKTIGNFAKTNDIEVNRIIEKYEYSQIYKEDLMPVNPRRTSMNDHNFKITVNNNRTNQMNLLGHTKRSNSLLGDPPNMPSTFNNIYPHKKQILTKKPLLTRSVNITNHNSKQIRSYAGKKKKYLIQVPQNSQVYKKIKIDKKELDTKCWQVYNNESFKADLSSKWISVNSDLDLRMSHNTIEYKKYESNISPAVEIFEYDKESLDDGIASQSPDTNDLNQDSLPICEDISLQKVDVKSNCIVNNPLSIHENTSQNISSHANLSQNDESNSESVVFHKPDPRMNQPYSIPWKLIPLAVSDEKIVRNTGNRGDPRQSIFFRVLKN